MEITPALIAKKLNSAADLLETKGWTTNTYARSATGKSCEIFSRTAVRYCVDGAIRRVLLRPGFTRSELNIDFDFREAMVSSLEKFLKIYSIIEWNDTRRSAKSVIAALRGAAKQVLADA